jgi:hypothetical protein
LTGQRCRDRGDHDLRAGRLTRQPVRGRGQNGESSKFDTFSIPVAPAPTTQICAMVVPIGENNGILTAAVQNILTSPVI